MRISDNLFKKIEKKTSVDKDTIISLAKNLQNDNMKNETALRDVIKQLSIITGKEVSKEKEDKIVNSILSDNIPKNIEKMI